MPGSELTQRGQLQPARVATHAPQEAVHVVIVEEAGQHRFVAEVRGDVPASGRMCWQ
ncbi:MAG: hypothetical protein U0452_09750 [Anaerolineae bacterium]